MFMYMAGYDDEERFDEEVVRDMTVRGHLGKIGRPTLLATGEYDPLCPLEDAIEPFEELKSAREMCVFENQHHILWVCAPSSAASHCFKIAQGRRAYELLHA